MVAGAQVGQAFLLARPRPVVAALKRTGRQECLPHGRMTSPDERREWVLAALEQFEGRLTRYAQRLTCDLDKARDVVQYVFLKLCDQSPKQIENRLAQWLYTVCRNR